MPARSAEADNVSSRRRHLRSRLYIADIRPDPKAPKRAEADQPTTFHGPGWWFKSVCVISTAQYGQGLLCCSRAYVQLRMQAGRGTGGRRAQRLVRGGAERWHGQGLLCCSRAYVQVRMQGEEGWNGFQRGRGVRDIT